MEESNKILLIHKFLVGEATEEEKKVLRDTQEKGSMESEIETYKLIWEKSLSIEKPSVDLDKNELKGLIFNQIDNNIVSVKNITNGKIAGIRIIKNVLAIAAISLILLFVGNLIYGTLTMTTIKASGEVVFSVLPDNSKIWLDDNSSIKFKNTFSKNEREIKLKGSAYINVAHDIKRPFSVIIGNNLIKVIGTSFQIISHRNRDIEVSVHEGEVHFFKPDNGFVVLKSGEGAIYNDKGNSINRKSATDFNTDIRADYLSFQNAELSDVFKKLSDFYNCKIYINCDEVAQMGGYTSPGLLADNIEKYFLTIEKLYKVRIEKIDNNNYRVNCLIK